jgi:hypothetical protein
LPQPGEVLPLGVWQDHLTPWLSVVAATRLRRTCEALRGVMDECPVDLGKVHVEDLKAALTCFPSAQSLDIDDCEPGEEKKWVRLLRRHGGTLKRVTAQGEGGEKVLSSAVRAGALPNLNYYRVTPWDSQDRQLLGGWEIEHGGGGVRGLLGRCQ